MKKYVPATKLDKSYLLNQIAVFEGKVYMREIECGSYYSQYGDLEINNNSYFTEELLDFEGLNVKITIEVIK